MSKQASPQQNCLPNTLVAAHVKARLQPQRNQAWRPLQRVGSFETISFDWRNLKNRFQGQEAALEIWPSNISVKTGTFRDAYRESMRRKKLRAVHADSQSHHLLVDVKPGDQYPSAWVGLENAFKQLKTIGN